MGFVSRTADLYYTFRFLRLLTTPWEELEAFKHGIIDKDGNVLRKASTLKTDEEKSCYNMFHRLVFNIKRLLNKLPFGKTKIASYAAALLLLKEETGMTEAGIKRIFERLDTPISMELTESTWFLSKKGELQPGAYKLLGDVPHRITGEPIGREGSIVVVEELTAPSAVILGCPVYEVRHRDSRQIVLISQEDITL
jgi:hypothetical protein